MVIMWLIALIYFGSFFFEYGINDNIVISERRALRMIKFQKIDF